MVTISILSILISNAVTLRRDLSILFNRIAMIALMYAILQVILSFSNENPAAIGLHGGL